MVKTGPLYSVNNVNERIIKIAIQSEDMVGCTFLTDPHINGERHYAHIASPDNGERNCACTVGAIIEQGNLNFKGSTHKIMAEWGDGEITLEPPFTKGGYIFFLGIFCFNLYRKTRADASPCAPIGINIGYLLVLPLLPLPLAKDLEPTDPLPPPKDQKPSDLSWLLDIFYFSFTKRPEPMYHLAFRWVSIWLLACSSYVTTTIGKGPLSSRSSSRSFLVVASPPTMSVTSTAIEQSSNFIQW